MKIAANILVYVVCLIIGCRANNNKEVISTGTLLYDMIDLGRLTYLPEVKYKTIQFSSYDRRSTLPGKPDWFQNSDGFGKEPLPGFAETLSEPDSSGMGRYLICDLDTPGVIVRTWTAMINGTFTVWLDNLNEPAYEGPANRGFGTNYRFQILDDMPFHQRFAFFMELYHHGRVDGIAYGRIAYYYATSETIDDNMIISDDDLRVQKLPHWETPVGYLGSANTEFFESEDVITVYPADRLFPGELWTGGQIIYYEFSRKGD